MRRTYLTGLLVLALAGLPNILRAEDLVSEALAGFPPETIRVEFSSPAKLRKLSNYQNLRQRYVGPRLQALESALAELGVREESIDDLMLGWQPGKGDMGLYGFASGRFDPKAIAESAAARGMSPSPVAGEQAYCLEAGLAGSCVVVLGNSLGAFGTLTSLTAMLEGRAGQGSSLSSSDRLARLIGDAKKDAPIWGVAVGVAVGDWFRGWMPNQGNLKLDWGRVFETVESLVYSVEAGEKVKLDLKLDCTTTEDATTLRQVLEGLKLAQQLAWQDRNPNRPNPFEGMEISLSGRQISLQVTTGYSELELAGGVAAPSN